MNTSIEFDQLQRQTFFLIDSLLNTLESIDPSSDFVCGAQDFAFDLKAKFTSFRNKEPDDFDLDLD